MLFSRRVGVIGIVVVTWLAALACDDANDARNAAEDGESGRETSSAGKSSSTAGGGQAGSGGSGGASSGTDTGGDFSSSGSGGKAGGEAGDAGKTAGGGSGGMAGGGAGAAAGGGDGGAADGGAGGSGTVVAKACSFSCVDDHDCLIGSDGHEKCNPSSHRCEDLSSVCSDDDDCLISLSAWSQSCTDDTGCALGTQVCVAVSGRGFCATLAASGGSPCASPNVPKTLDRFGAAGTANVCASADPRCFNGSCGKGCGDVAAHCGVGDGDTCDTATGRCGCTGGSECDSGVCNSNGHCDECASDDDCSPFLAYTGLGICVHGKCACESAATCVDPGYASASAVCE